jgi:hypothetical protein
MRSILLATCIAVGAASTAFVTPVRAEVAVSVPGVTVETGGDHHGDRRESTRRDEVSTNRSKSVSHEGDKTTVRRSDETTVR